MWLTVLVNANLFIHKTMARLTPTELAKEISNFVNGARPEEIKELALLMSNDHPTLQQNTMGLAAHFIQAMATKNYVDARNEASKEMALSMIHGYGKILVDKFVEQGMDKGAALRQSAICIGNLAANLPFI